MASFPTTAWTKADITNGQTSDASDVNDIAHEVQAIEDGYLNGTARLNSSNTTVNAFSAAAGSTFAAAVVFSTQFSAPQQPHVDLTHSTLQAFSSASTTSLTWDTETVDIGGLHSTSATPTRVTIPAGSSGWYVYQGSVFVPTTVATSFGFTFLRNSSQKKFVQTPTNATFGVSAVISGGIFLNATDFAELAIVTGASTLSVSTGGSAPGAKPSFTLTKVS